MRVLLFLQVFLHDGVERDDPAVAQLAVEVHLLLLHFRAGLHHLQRGVVVVAVLHRLQLLRQAIKDQDGTSIIKPGEIRVDVLVLLLGETLVAAAVDGRDEQQGAGQGDDGDDEGRAELVLHLLLHLLVEVGDVDDAQLLELIPLLLQLLEDSFRV